MSRLVHCLKISRHAPKFARRRMGEILLCFLLCFATAARGADCPEAWLPGLGVAGVNGTVNAACEWIDQQGKSTLVVAGSFTIAGESRAISIAAWDGTSWRSLGNTSSAEITALVADGTDLYMSTGLTVWKRAGDGWTSLGKASGGSVNDIHVWNGAIYAGGTFTAFESLTNCRVVKLSNGAWSAVGRFQGSGVYKLAHFNNELIAAGNFLANQSGNARNLARWDGTTWRQLGPNSSGTVYTLLVDGGSIIAAGDFSVASIAGVQNVAKWDGVALSPIGQGVSQSLDCLVIHNGSLIAGGKYRSSKTPQFNRPLTWTGDQWVAFDSVDFGGLASFSAICSMGDRLYFAGQFKNAGATRCANVTAWQDQSWRALGTSGLDAGPKVLAHYLGTLIAGGTFSYFGQQPVAGVAVWNGSEWTPLGDGISNVSALRVDGTNVFVAARASDGGYYCFWWSGYEWVPLGDPLSFEGTTPQLNAIEILNGSVVVAGRFDFAGSTPARNIARWNGFQWEAFGSGIDASPVFCANAYVYALATFQGSLIAGGSFDAAGDKMCNLVARWDGTQWQPMADGLRSSACNPSVQCLLSDGSFMYASGTFDRIGESYRDGLARWNGIKWEFVSNTTQPGYEYMKTTITKHGSNIIAACNVNPGTKIREWNGESWRDIGEVLDSGVNSLAVFGDELWASGGFRGTASVVSVGVARLPFAGTCCTADFNHDARIDDSDFLVFIGAYDVLDCADPSMPSGCPSDLDGDGLVNDSDFVVFLAAYDALICS